jgi:hypothetical protein
MSQTSGCAPSAPPDNDTATQPAHRGKIMCEDHHSQRDHPETKNWQEAEQPEKDKNNAKRDAKAAGCRQIELPFSKFDVRHGESDPIGRI